jgi:hypothetical protein
MVSLRSGRLREAWWGRGAAIAVALLALVTGLCLLERDEGAAGGHATGPDLCLVTLAAFLVAMPLVPLVAVGAAIGLPFMRPDLVALHVPDPPPKPR